MKSFKFNDFVHKKTLMKGEVGSGKTAVMLSLIEQAVEDAHGVVRGRITVIDMAPERIVSRGRTVGGTMNLKSGRPNDMIIQMNATLVPPRLKGETGEQVLQLARENACKIDAMLERYLAQPTEVLFVNDLTMYLHAGRLEKLLKVIGNADTFIGNAYEGKSLSQDFGSGITERETYFLTKIDSLMDRIINLV